MTISREQVEREFRRLNRSINFEQISSQALSFREDLTAATTTRLGIPGATVLGFESLTTQLDVVIANLPLSHATQLTGQMGVTRMTEQVPQITDRVITRLEGTAGDLAAITEQSTDEIDNGFLDVVISGNTPAAIAAGIASAVDTTVEEVTSIIQDNVIDASLPLFNDLDEMVGPIREIVAPLSNVITNSVNTLTQVISSHLGTISSIQNRIETSLGSFGVGLNSLISNVVERVIAPVQAVLDRITTINNVVTNLPEFVSNRVRELISQSAFGEAARLLQRFSDLSVNDIEDRLRGIDTTLGGNLDTPSDPGGSIDPTIIGANESSWDEERTQPEAFSFVATHEELEVELKSLQREVTELIVHWTETNINQDIGAEELQEFYAEHGQGVPYHYFIRRDGSLQRGRPINEIGPELPNNHHQYAIQIAFVGGINAPADEPEIMRYLSRESLTSAQMNTFRLFLEKSYAAWPGLQALGHNEIDQNQVDPGFNVTEYAENTFNKLSIYTDTFSQQAYNRVRLISTPIPDYIYHNSTPR